VANSAAAAGDGVLSSLAKSNSRQGFPWWPGPIPVASIGWPEPIPVASIGGFRGGLDLFPSRQSWISAVAWTYSRRVNMVSVGCFRAKSRGKRKRKRHYISI